MHSKLKDVARYIGVKNQTTSGRLWKVGVEKRRKEN